MSFCALRLYFSIALIVACLAVPARAETPPLREQVSLNGQWPEGGMVPVYAGEKITTKVYAREAAAPAAWAGKAIKLEFGGVNFSAEILGVNLHYCFR